MVMSPNIYEEYDTLAKLLDRSEIIDEGDEGDKIYWKQKFEILVERYKEHINTPDRWGWTLLHRAVKTPNRFAVKTLLRVSGVDTFLETTEGETAMDLAERRLAELEKILLKHEQQSYVMRFFVEGVENSRQQKKDTKEIIKMLQAHQRIHRKTMLSKGQRKRRARLRKGAKRHADQKKAKFTEWLQTQQKKVVVGVLKF